MAAGALARRLRVVVVFRCDSRGVCAPPLSSPCCPSPRPRTPAPRPDLGCPWPRQIVWLRRRNVLQQALAEYNTMLREHGQVGVAQGRER